MERVDGEKVVLNEICEEMSCCLRDLLGRGEGRFVGGDGEWVVLGGERRRKID